MADKRNHKGSKKSKRSWRKNTDVDDIEEHLEDCRKDERTGGVIAGKVDESLFFVDKVVNNEEKKGRTKCDTEVDDDDDVYVSRKQLLQQKLAKEKADEERRADITKNSKQNNIWGQEVIAVTDAYLEPTIKKKKVKPSTVGVGRSELEAVTVPEAGASYNPDYDSHQDLLNKAHLLELKKLKNQEKLNNKVKMVSVKELKNQSKLWLEEMSEGLFEKNNNSNKVEIRNDNEELSASEDNVMEEPKTSKQRRKEKLQKEQDRQLLEEKKEKRKLNDIYRIKTFKKEIQKADEISALRQKKKLEKVTHQMKTRSKRLSKHKYTESEISVHLSEELTGSLRELKPEGSLLEDRFKSLQKRNVIETRKPVVPRRRYKRKVYEKRSYKSGTIRDFKLKM